MPLFQMKSEIGIKKAEDTVKSRLIKRLNLNIK